MTTVPTPPEAEQRRQKMVHSLRMERATWAKILVESNYTLNPALHQIEHLNAQISILHQLREPYPATDAQEPSLNEIKARGLDWYWEEWRTDDDEGDDDAQEG